jgi:phosphotransferase system enzyme I (PtsI)
MVPLVVDIEELRSVKAIVKELMADLDKEGIKYNKDIKIGVMVETPAASLIADLLAQEADFFSIGTNDLTGYTMCVDRGNADVAYLYSTFQPAVLRSIKHIIECGNEKGIMVGMCGEAAADPMLIPLLISFGLKEFSVSATSVLATRKEISKWTKAEADKVAEKVMAMTSEKDVCEYLKSL